ncbi:hypothetical protein LFL97_03205 [Burkholderia sp. JSH-S8]|uniref:hypothetical protein n=1 Tax=Burkholderia stagnalis TaxID=1503054 RepID=UPI000A6AD539|nr:hypothetical protein [Burkholderia stagnalis]WGS43991.1 hypothetical protein LFL97_03205 [Burkholderia sp. JSH-S8]
MRPKHRLSKRPLPTRKFPKPMLPMRTVPKRLRSKCLLLGHMFPIPLRPMHK